MSESATPVSTALSMSMRSGAPAKSRRRTAVSPSRLLAMFEQAPAPPMSQYASARRPADDEVNGRRTNSVATQSTMSAGHFGLCELLFNQPPGEVNSASHAADRRLLLQQFDHRQIDLIADERYGRVQVFLQHREFLDAMWRAFCKTLPRMDAQHRALMERRDFDGLRALREKEAAAAAESGRAEDESEVERRTKELTTENELLKHQVQLLERRVASKVQAVLPVGPTGDRRSIAGALSRMPAAHQLEALSEFLETTVVAEEARTRTEGVEALQTAMRATLLAQWEAGCKSIEIRTAQRFMVLPPFQGYRPKVPTEHSLAPEEYLRKCLVAETCKHYDDCMCLLQRHENSERIAIGDEAMRILATAWDVYMAPFRERDLRTLRTQLAALQTSNAEISSHVHDLALTDKLKVLEDAEQDTRGMFADVRNFSHDAMQSIAQRLESVAVLSRRIGELQRELHKQAQRHKRETAILAEAIPRGLPGVPEAHTAMLPLDTRAAFSVAGGSDDTPQSKPLSAFPPKTKPDRQRGMPIAASARPPMTPTEASRGVNGGDRLPSVGPPRAHPPSAADGRRRPSSQQTARTPRSRSTGVPQLRFSGYL